MNSVTKISRIDVNFGEYDVAKWIVWQRVLVWQRVCHSEKVI